LFNVGDVGKRMSEDVLKITKALGCYNSFTNIDFTFPPSLNLNVNKIIVLY